MSRISDFQYSDLRSGPGASPPVSPGIYNGLYFKSLPYIMSRFYILYIKIQSYAKNAPGPAPKGRNTKNQVLDFTIETPPYILLFFFIIFHFYFLLPFSFYIFENIFKYIINITISYYIITISYHHII
jgi:hypothetical protein